MIIENYSDVIREILNDEQHDNMIRYNTSITKITEVNLSTNILEVNLINF